MGSTQLPTASKGLDNLLTKT